jgi:alkanesulfonate monooxygenase SsuD/methylene tetrahydromethanopterin reductase-like flavin-dependent oxidoreductase (luciferase family)
MNAIAARSEKINIGTLVICNSCRNPALLAKSLTTIDHISNGCLEVGLGAGGWKRSAAPAAMNFLRWECC